mmetsp:Transcript_37555/g.75103  ORF Transcript_37555/g.75103 Transcript_37555/m.75103 type:complete len:178 (-) Transcript_37555:163-696(-)
MPVRSHVYMGMHKFIHAYRHNVFGYLLLASGLFHALLIGLLLGRPPATVPYLRAAGVGMVCAALMLSSISLILITTVNEAWYIELDPLVQLLARSTLVNGLTEVVISLETTEIELQVLKQMSQPAPVRILFIAYMLLHAYQLAIDIYAVVVCCKAYMEIRKRVVPVYFDSRPRIVGS